jgi:hypothetical protein
MDHETWSGLYMFVQACVRAFTYVWMDYLQTCWEHTTNHHKLHWSSLDPQKLGGLFNLCMNACADSAPVYLRVSITYKFMTGKD